MHFKILRSNTDTLLQKAFEVRREVFVIEQEVAPEEEFDEFEDESRHFVAFDEFGNPIATSRWRRTDKGIKLERFAVKQSARGRGLGSAMVKATMKDILQHVESGTYLYMHAQLDAVALYEKFGFQKKGEQFEECNILHYLMWKTA